MGINRADYFFHVPEEITRNYRSYKKLEEKISFEEFLDLEEDSDIRHEFSNGIRIPIEAITKAHNRIKRNLIRAI